MKGIKRKMITAAISASLATAICMSIPLSGSALVTDMYLKDDKYICDVIPNTIYHFFVMDMRDTFDLYAFISDGTGQAVAENYVVKTGDYVITNGSRTWTYQAVIFGDVNGDGDVTMDDVYAITDVLAGGSISGAYKEAADTDQDGSVTVSDLMETIRIMNRIHPES